MALVVTMVRVVPGEGWLGGLGIVPLVGAGVAFWFNERQQAHRAMVTLCATAVALGYGIWGIGAARVGEHQNSVPLIAAVRELRPDHWQLASYRYSASSLVYYTQKHVNFFSEPRDVANFLASGDDRFVVVPADYLEEVQSSLPSDVQILVRQRRFAREGKEILLLGRTPSIALQTGRRHND